MTSPPTVSIRLLICGSRYYTDEAEFEKIVKEWIRVNGEPQIIIAGEANGADTLAKKYAKRNLIEYEGYPAQWSGTGRQRKAAGPIRNSLMLTRCTHVLALPSRNGTGTQDTMRKAKAKGIPVTPVYVD